MPSNSNVDSLIREKLSKEEASKLIELLHREIPLSRYVKFFDEKTGEVMDFNTELKRRQELLTPKPSTCYDYFLDYMNCHVRCSFM
jgi:hypothetical protein